MGNFERDNNGRIINREMVLRKGHFRDQDNHVVNERGYLIDETTGDIRSRYTFDILFHHYELVGVGDRKFELPMPYRLEKYNFNPHECMGNLDWILTPEKKIVPDWGG